MQGDAQALRSLLRNLIDNAIQHGGAAPHVMVEHRGRRRDHALLRVDDSGAGIPPAERERVFDRFHRREGSAGDGSGLGLAIVRAIAHQHGGEVELERIAAGRLARRGAAADRGGDARRDAGRLILASPSPHAALIVALLDCRHGRCLRPPPIWRFTMRSNRTPDRRRRGVDAARRGRRHSADAWTLPAWLHKHRHVATPARRRTPQRPQPRRRSSRCPPARRRTSAPSCKARRAGRRRRHGVGPAQRRRSDDAPSFDDDPFFRFFRGLPGFPTAAARRHCRFAARARASSSAPTA